MDEETIKTAVTSNKQTSVTANWFEFLKWQESVLSILSDESLENKEKRIRAKVDELYEVIRISKEQLDIIRESVCTHNGEKKKANYAWENSARAVPAYLCTLCDKVLWTAPEEGECKAELTSTHLDCGVVVWYSEDEFKLQGGKICDQDNRR